MHNALISFPMKKLIRHALPLLAAAITALAAFGQKTVSITTTDYGQLANLLGDEFLTLDSLSITGPIDSSDFTVMRTAIRQGVLRAINLENAQCMDNEIPDGGLLSPFIPLWNTALEGDISNSKETSDSSHEWVILGQIKKQLNNFRRIILPPTLQRIGKEAFAGSNIEEIDLPQSIQVLDEACFLGSNLKKIVIGSQIKTVAKHSFEACPYLDDVTILDPVEFLDERSFSRNNLTKLEIPGTIRNMDFAFFDSAVEQAVFNAPDLTGIYLQNKYMKKAIFNEGVSIIGEYICNGCQDLTQIGFPSSLRSIGVSAFANCSSLNSVFIPEGCLNIDAEAFFNSGLNNLYLPSTIETIGSKAFPLRQDLTEVYSRSNIPTSISSDAFYYADEGADLSDHPSNIKLFVPKGSAGLYRNTPGWNCFSDYIEIDESQFPSGIHSVNSYYPGPLSMHQSEHSVSFTGITGFFCIFDIKGKAIKSGFATNGSLYVTLPQGTYVITHNGKSLKFFAE